MKMLVALIAQLVEHLTEDLKDLSSIPGWALQNFDHILNVLSSL